MDSVAVDEALTVALLDALGYLAGLQRDGVRPGPAQAGFDRLRERHPGTGMDLVWEEEPYGATVHYDALLHGDGGTVSLSYCPDRAVPWPLRGVQRWTDKELVRVNTTAMRVDQAIACLDFIWDDRRIIDRLVNACLIQEALAREPIELSDEELQQAMDGFRRARRLYTAEETQQWMARRGMTHEQLEEYVGDTALVDRLRRRVTAGRVDAYFTANRERFDAAVVARIDFAAATDARQAGDRVRGGQTDFYALAEQRFREGTQPAGPPAGQPSRELFALIRRGQVAEPLAAAVFAAAPGEVIGPVPWEGGHSLLRVLEFIPARLDEPTRREIERLLFDEWLEDRRRAATIEWNWGSAARTGDG